MPNKKALEIAKQLGRPLPATPKPVIKAKDTTINTIAANTKPIRPTIQNLAKPRAAFRPQAFKPPRGA
jgi:hypothetical protein